MHRPNILLPDPPSRPKHQIRHHPSNTAPPANQIAHIPLRHNLLHQSPNIQILRRAHTLRKHPAAGTGPGVERAAVGGAVDARWVDAETWVGEPGGGGWVGDREDAVAVAVEEFAVLLEYGLVAVVFGPGAGGRAVGFGVGGGDGGAG
ncbi:hypothetical protein EJ07DRAFT_157577 [Lizonia empirigonia]|nr:hypothetical protein EJ07DRAFT_157577 [Lizonia empirigonia]